jgi:asparagine synthase (glutamine-hydrolysing)
MIGIRLAAGGWARRGATSARGYAHLDGRFLRADGIASALDACANDEAWRDVIRRLNGCFAVVTEHPDHVLAAVDRVRTIPLFYASGDGEGWLSDDARWVLERSGSHESNEIGSVEFGLTGYVTGAETLFLRVRQIQAGRVLRLGKSAVQDRYYEYRHGEFHAPDVERLIPALEAVHERVFRRLLDGAEGRQIVVPLSGGYDSRLIGVSLRDLGAKDVVCYSYGLPGNWESRISKELADYLGFRWEFVEYSAARWRAWGETAEFRDYLHRAGNLTSVPHIQDWPAVRELSRARRISADGVIVPGHSGDFLAGSHVPKWFVKRANLERRDFLDSIARAHYSLWDWPAGRAEELRGAFDQRVESIVGPVGRLSAEQAADLFERWDLEERQAKFICNSMRAYEAFGHEWRLPLFDAELMDFWARIPVVLRAGRHLYFEFVRCRQTLPITEANRDHGAIVEALLEAIDMLGLRPVAKRAQRFVRRMRWARVYDTSPLAWFALVDRDRFRRTYTGKELMHSYLAIGLDERHTGDVARDAAPTGARREAPAESR